MAKIKVKDLVEVINDIGLCIIKDVFDDPFKELNTYDKYEFNSILDNLKKKQVKEIVGKAKTSLELVRAFSLTIDSRVYNMFRYLEDNR